MDDLGNIKQNKKGKKTKIALLILLAVLLTVGIGFSLAAFIKTLSSTKSYVLLSYGLELTLDESKTLTDVVGETGAKPVSDKVGMETEGYTFSLTNSSDVALDYTIYLDEDNANTMPIYALRYNLTEETAEFNITENIEDTTDEEGNRKLYSTKIKYNETHTYNLKIWLGLQAENDAKNKVYSAKIRVEVSQSTDYVEETLNGTDPVLTDNLIPVLIADDGTVTKADIKDQWYHYANQEWANAVVLADNTINYDTGTTIPEENIESYFVWIPRFRYKIFDEGNYTSLTGLDSAAVQTIEIEFENKYTEPSIGTTEGSWLTHPAFTAFDSNGFWVGKFETGYNGATSTATAEVNSSDSSKIIIKPNKYSWRNMTVGNAFKASYDYMREEESHMMKNTEWGAVAYLQHSIYGSRVSVRVNNNSAHITGYAAVVEPTLGYNATSISGNQYGTETSVTLPYDTTTGYLASTTGNISGVYDMSGGANEYVMGYNTAASTVGGSSEITQNYEDFFTSTDWEKYYDRYNALNGTQYNTRILGDATGEMGSFRRVIDSDSNGRNRGSWYEDWGQYVDPDYPWFHRGGACNRGIASGVFAFDHGYGTSTKISFRVVLTP